MRQIFLIALMMASGLLFADSKVEGFFQSIEGKWHGEWPGIYIIDIEVTALNTSNPWSLQRGKIEIKEGSTTNYEFELSKNESQLDQEAVYFLKVINLTNNETFHYTLSSRANIANPLSFWRHLSGENNGEVYTSANAVKIYKTNETLTWGFVTGNGYCTNKGNTSLCATDGYTPYEMQKVRTLK